MIGLRLGARTREERVTPVRTNPPGEVPIKIVARRGGSARGGVTRRPFGAAALDQAACELAWRLLVLGQRALPWLVRTEKSAPERRRSSGCLGGVADSPARRVTYAP